MALDFSSTVSLTAVYVVLSTVYTWRIVARQREGLARFVCFLPVLLVNASLPFLYEAQGIHIYGRLICAYHLAWLSSYKVVCLVSAFVPSVERLAGAGAVSESRATGEHRTTAWPRALLRRLPAARPSGQE